MRVMPNENITMTTNNRTKAIQTGIILLTVDITKYMCSEKAPQSNHILHC